MRVVYRNKTVPTVSIQVRPVDENGKFSKGTRSIRVEDSTVEQVLSIIIEALEKATIEEVNYET